MAHTKTKVKKIKSQKIILLAVVLMIFAFLGAYLLLNSKADVGSTANIWVASNGNDSGSNCTRSSAIANPDSTGLTLCKTMSTALSKASAGDTIRLLAGDYPSQSISRTGLTRDTDFTNNIKFIANDGPGSVTLAGLSIGSSSAGSYGGVSFDGFHVTGGPAIQESTDVLLQNMEANNQTYISNSQYIKLYNYKVQPNGWPATSSTPFSNGWGIGIVQQGSGSVSAPSNITLDKIIIRGVRATQAADHPDGVFMWRGGGVSSAAQWTGFAVRNSLFYNNECINWRYNDANPVQIVFENNFFDSSVNGISGCGYYSISVASETGTYKNNTIRGGVQVKEGDCAANCGAVRTWKNNIILGGFSDQGCSNLSNDVWNKNIVDGSRCSTNDISSTASAIKFAGGSTYPDALFLTSGSLVAIDAGDGSSGSYTPTDYLGTPRPQGTAPDIGAYEYQSGTGGGNTCSSKQGDANGDNSVNILDISAILSSYGQTNTTSCTDVNNDKSINILDISLVLSKYGT